MKESWALHKMKMSNYQPYLLHFNDWPAEKAKAHERMRANAPKNRNNEIQVNAGPYKTVAKILSSDKKPYQQYPPCVVCNGKQAICYCTVYKEETPTQRANLLPSRSCVFPVCNRTRFFDYAQNLESATNLIATALTMRSFTEPKEHTPQRLNKFTRWWKIFFAFRYSGGGNSWRYLRHSRFSVKGLLQIVELKLSSNTSNSNTPVLCDSACSHSWISAQLVEKHKLSGTKLNRTVNGINSQQVFMTEQIEIVNLGNNDTNSYNSHARPFVKIDLNLNCDSACSHSWLSAQLLEKQKLSGDTLNRTVSGINSQQS